MLAQNEQKKLALITTIVFWAIILGGLMASPVSYIISEGILDNEGLINAARDFYLSLFVHGFNNFSIMVYGAAPFMILALFSLIHLSIVIESDKDEACLTFKGNCYHSCNSWRTYYHNGDNQFHGRRGDYSTTPAIHI